MVSQLECILHSIFFYDIIGAGDIMIKHYNIVYIRNINSIGGVETYTYELIKKYHYLDIAVVCKTIAPEQLRRLREYCRVYKHTNQEIECKVIITNWDTSIIKYINKEAKVYTGLHTDYSHLSQGSLPVDDDRITYIGITEDSKKKFEKLSGITRTILCRNPLSVEKKEKPLVLMSATRLTEEKGGHRMLEIADELDRQKINYIWYVFTTNEYPTNPIWQNKNVIKMENRLDLDYFYNQADWYIQCSEVEGDSYSLKEALYRGIPIVVCELPYFKEYGIEDNKNALFLDINCSNTKDVVSRMLKPLKFSFEQIEDGYDKILAEGKSHYEEDRKMKAKVKALMDFTDLEEDVKRREGEEWVCSLERAEYLQDNKGVEILEVTKEEKPKTETKKVAVDIPKKKKHKNM